MTRLTKAELAQHYAWLTSWHMPEETIFYVRQVNDYMGSVDFFAQAGVTFVRDAWDAGHFGQVRGAATVRLVADQWPDFELCICDAVERFEFVEADLEGRRRADEYKAVADEMEAQGFSSVEDDSVEDWIARAEEAPAAVARAIEQKLAKRYVKGTSRIVMVKGSAARRGREG